ncbi:MULTISPECIES: efflux transporter outer membrane subunit [Niveibacterium]|uniref:TolC family protein n=1 Tax=Niveibacterium microcysteis TaxID=2811415 RepID=A0ABX7M8L2_9RHOO|nr:MULTISPECIES: TolC family protein [Niveibacterium]QSI78075.1 TolC family protein [Niveibacterium microcysteis]
MADFNLSRAAFAVALALVAGGCALQSPPKGADLRAQTLPNAPLPESWKAGAPSGQFEDGWLARFNDPQLIALVNEAIANNPDLKVAAARIEQASAIVTASGGSLWPSVMAYGRTGGKMSDGSGLTGGGLSVNWELDLWGRVRSQRAAATAQYDSTVADLAWARQSLAAGVARAWYLAIEAQQQRKLAEQSIAATQSLIKLEETRQRVGNTDGTAVSTAREALAARQDSLEQLKLAETQTQRALELLLGRYPAAELAVAGNMPAMPEAVPAGLPSQLLERRPDIISAERKVAASFYMVEEAKAARLPAIKLTAGVNSIDSSLFVLADRNNPVWSMGAGIVAPLFTGGALQAQVEAKTAEQKAAVAAYTAAGQRAFADVENALAANVTLQTRAKQLDARVLENRRQVELANHRLRVGSIDRRALINEELGLIAVQGEQLRVQSDARVQRVNLHLALGGDFAPSAPLAATTK